MAFIIAAAAPGMLLAGDPIQFSYAKVAPTTSQRGKLTKGFESGRAESLGGGGSLEMIVPSISGGTLDPKEERKRKETAMEKKNWMIFEQGHFQEQHEEEESLGVRPLDNLEKEKTASEYWFGPQSDDAGRAPGQSRSPGSIYRARGTGRAPQAGPARSAREFSGGGGEGERGGSSASRSGYDGQGAHIARELNLSSLFAPNGSAADKPAPVFKFSSGSGSRATSMSDTRSSMAGFGSGSSLGSLLGLDPQAGASAPVVAPVFSGSFDNSSRSFNGGGMVDRGPAGAFGQPKGVLGAPGWGEALSSRPNSWSGGLGSSSPLQQQQNENRLLPSHGAFDRPKIPGQ